MKGEKKSLFMFNIVSHPSPEVDCPFGIIVEAENIIAAREMIHSLLKKNWPYDINDRELVILPVERPPK